MRTKVRQLTLKDRHKHLLKMVRSNWLKLTLAMSCMIVMAGATSATAFLVKPVLDDIFLNKDLIMLKLVPIVIIAVYFINGISRYGQSYLMNYVGESIIKDLRDMLYDRIQDLSLAFFHEEKTGALMSRITNDVQVIKSMVSLITTFNEDDSITIKRTELLVNPDHIES